MVIDWVWFAEKINDMPAPFWALLGAIIGGAITGIYAHINNARLKQLEYANAYFQKLTEKRMKIYEEIEAAIFPLRSLGIQHGTGRKYLLKAVNDGGIELVNAYGKLAELRFKGRWLSLKSRQQLAVLTDELLAISMSISEMPEESDRVDLAVAKRDELIKMINNLATSLNDDYFELHEIKSLFPKRVWLGMHSRHTPPQTRG